MRTPPSSSDRAAGGVPAATAPRLPGSVHPFSWLGARSIRLSGLLAGLLVLGTAPSALADDEPPAGSTPADAAYEREMASRSSSVLARSALLERELTAMVERLRPGVVAIRSRREVPGGAVPVGVCEGTGVVLDDGSVATTLSVAGPGDEIEITYYDGRVSSAEVRAVDPVRELVILEPPVAAAGGLTPGSPDSLHAGSWVFVFSFSLRAPEAALASGRFSSRTILDLTGREADPVQLLQLEATVYPGNSGGAVIDAHGNLVGLVVGGLSHDGYLDPVVLASFADAPIDAASVMMTQPPLGVSLALPVDDVVALAERSREEDAVPGRAFVGIRVETAPTRLGAGVPILEVVRESPAERSGVQTGDRLMTVDGRDVDGAASLAGLLGGRAPGTVTTLGLRTPGGEVRTATVHLGDYTADYQMRFVWGRLLSGRTESLTTARARLLRHLEVIDRELLRVAGTSRVSLGPGGR